MIVYEEETLSRVFSLLRPCIFVNFVGLIKEASGDSTENLTCELKE